MQEEREKYETVEKEKEIVIIQRFGAVPKRNQ
jgi:hypothetical protein